jgi:hypothetical protein
MLLKDEEPGGFIGFIKTRFEEAVGEKEQIWGEFRGRCMG